MSKKNSNPTVDAATAEKVSSLVDFCANKLMFGLVPKTFILTLFLLLLYFINFSVNDISGITGFCQKTVRKKIKTFNNQGLEALFVRKKGVGRKSATASLINEIENDLETHDYRCSKQIQHILSFRFNIKLCLSSVRNILKKLNFKFLKSGSLPAKADPIAQRHFYDDVLHPLMQMAKENKCALFFMDGAHFVFGCEHLGSVWAKCRRFIKTFSGRKRWNVLGCLNFMTKEIHTVANDEYLTATQVIEMFEMLAQQYVNIPIKIVLDNARYQHCKAVMRKAQELGIELSFLPPYSPNLNLIERVWKYVKKEISVLYFDNFDDFRNTIMGVISETHTKRKGEMDTLIGEKVQLFDNLVEKSEISSEIHKSKETSLTNLALQASLDPAV